MVKVRKDLTGQMFGRLKVLRQAEDHITPKGVHRAQWVCECQCKKKTIKIVQTNSLIYKHAQSCGCFRDEKLSARILASKKKNKYDLTGEYGIGYTSNRPDIEFYFDLEDYDKIKDYTWLYHEKYHKIMAGESRANNTPGHPVYIHNVISGHFGTNHINKNYCDNRKSNLRYGTLAQICAYRGKSKSNKTGVSGVEWHSSNKRYCAVINVNKKRLYLGSSYEKNDVIRLRLQAEHDIYKEFAPQQHLYKEYGIPNARLHQYVIQRLTDKGYDVNSILA